jgi:hypothetical protein
VSLELYESEAQITKGRLDLNSAEQIPACFFPLNTEQALGEYDLLARKLADAGRLALTTHRALSSYVLQIDIIIKAKEAGKHIPAFWFATLDKARLQLKLEQLDDPVTRSAPLRNKFAGCGFSSRLRAV